MADFKAKSGDSHAGLTQAASADAKATLDRADGVENCAEQFSDPAGAEDERAPAEPQPDTPIMASRRALAARYPDSFVAVGNFVSLEASAMACGEQVGREAKGDFIRNNSGLVMTADAFELFAAAGIKVRRTKHRFLYHVKLLCSVAGSAMSAQQKVKAATFASCEDLIGCSPSEALIRHADALGRWPKLSRPEALLKHIREQMQALAGERKPGRANRAATIKVRIPRGQPVGDGDGLLAPVRAGEDKLRLLRIRTDGNELLADLSVADHQLEIKKVLHALRGLLLMPSARPSAGDG